MPWSSSRASAPSAQVNTVYNTLKAYERQLALQAQTIASQRILLRTELAKFELAKFELGESTIFLINA